MSFCMKVAVAVLALGFVSAPVMQARSGKHSQIMKVIRKYDGCDGVESIVIGSFLMGIARLASSGEEGDEILKYIFIHHSLESTKELFYRRNLKIFLYYVICYVYNTYI